MVVLVNKRVQGWFDNKLLLFLGRNSFGLYAVHWPVMLSAGCFVFLRLVNNFGYTIAAFMGLFITIGVSTFLAIVFSKITDAFTYTLIIKKNREI